jgi:amino acid adenylation domain-containing protein/non-ribosomal peptide synthase protein (TIGR01720 family)
MSHPIVDLYELSPMQQGMLFHTLYAPAAGHYIEQRICQIQGSLDIPAFKHAWQCVVDRHPILRTGFYWEDIEKPLQVVFEAAELSWIEQDWQSLTPEEQNLALEEFLEGDRTQDFELTQAPLMRCALLQIAHDTYKFVWTHHHLLMDGWCNAILLKEVLIFYQHPHQILPPLQPYREYILWLQQQDPAQSEHFWRNHLQGVTSPTRLSPYSQGNQTATGQSLQLDTTFTAQVQTFCQQHHITLNTLIQSAWSLLLSTYSHSTDILFGVTVSGRPSALVGVETMIGLLINTLPVRVQLPATADLLSWMQALQMQQQEREQYAHTALTDIQAWSEIPRGTPLFESLIVFENYPTSIATALQGKIPNLQISQSQGYAHPPYPLTLSVIPGNEILFQIDYYTEFTSEFVTRLLTHLKTILETITQNPYQRLSQISLISAAEQQQLNAWNQTDRPVSQHPVQQQFEAQVDRTPDAIALIYDDQHLTYAELNARANQLAHYLSPRTQTQTPIAVCLDRTPDLIISLLAILKLGVAYLPLDPAYPSDRLTFMLEDALVHTLITATSVSHSFLCSSIIYLDVHQSVIDQENSQNFTQVIAPTQPAYIIYTSGTTGKPKGVLIPHAALSNYTAAAADKFDMTVGDRVLQFASISFDTAAEEIYPALISGASLVLRSPEMIRTAETFVTTIRQQQITLLDLPTAYWQQLTQDMIAENLTLPPSVRLVIIGGEAASAQDLKAWQPFQTRLINTYGPTETTIVATWWEVESAGTVSIGKPIPNVYTYVLDQNLHQVPIGIPGELYIGGSGVALGYLNQDYLTVERFIPDPFRSPFHRMYKTGDRVRYLPDGNLEFLGRIDQQIKLRGFRIEPAEIETALKQHPDIQDAAVMLHPDSSQLIAYYVSPTYPTISDLRSFLAHTLPTYMIPAAFVALPTFPLTPSGKLDRRSLLQILPTLPTATATPHTPTEELLVNIWADLLGIQPSIHDNFFELGGHSLLATRVISQIHQVFGSELPLRQIFETPTIAELAQSLSAAANSSRYPQGIAPAPITPAPRLDSPPLSFAQQRQWFLHQLEPDSPLYTIPAAVEITGTLNVQAFQQSLNAILQRHEALRTAFLTQDGQPIQKILSHLEIECPIIDLSSLNLAEQQENIDRLLKQNATQAIAIHCPPLLRANLLHLNPQTHIVLLAIHHIVADGWSLGILLQELSTIYSAFSHQSTPSLPPLPVQYADFAIWQRSQTHLLEHQLTYWQEQLKDAPILELPTDHPRPAERTLQGANFSFCLSRSLTIALKQLSQKSGCTLFMTLLAAFQTLLHRYTGNDDLIVGTAIANRNRAEIERLIGFFINTLALRTDFSGNPTFTQLLHRVRATTLSAYAHQDLPFEQLVDTLHPQRSLSYTPLFQVMFVLQNAPFADMEIEGLQWVPLPSHSDTAKFDLTLSMQESDQGLTGTLEYSLDLFKPTTIQRLAGHLQTLVESIALNPDQPLSEICLLTATERQQFATWNQTQTLYPPCCIHEQFAAQVEQTPDAIALIYQSQTLTYTQLNQAANQLAHHLRSLGVGLETPVALCLERTPDLIITLLAILKAGGVYVPLDPTYPLERLRLILKDTQAKLLVTSSSYSLDVPQIHPQDYLPTCSKNNPISITNPDNLAYILYTSGSTGIPKGVCTPHRGIVRLVKSTNYVTLDSTETILQAAPLTFDAATFEIWGALLNGGRLVLLPESQPSLTDLANAISHHSITTLWLTAGLFSLMVTDQLASLQPLHQLLAGGDVLSPTHVQILRQAHPHIRLINGYGPTEGTTFTCCHTVTDTGTVPIGKPISNTQIFVLDSYLQSVPIGIPGELYIAGDGVARGYLNRSSLTAERFIPGQTGVLYKTGDRVRFREDGVLEYLGRLDQQVKIRGFRIEPSEIEELLVKHSAVKAAVVVPQLGEHKRLVAYVVAEDTPDLTQNLRQFLANQLPDYMIPALFVPLSSLPLTPNGKVDRARLAEQSAPTTIHDRPLVLPRTPIETALVNIWSTVLNLSTVSTEDNFFTLGGDSILAIQIVSRCHQAGFRITPKQLFQYQTIAELATVMSQPILAEQGLVVGTVHPTPIIHWFFERSLCNPHHFNQAVLLAVPSGLNPDQLQQVLQALQEHHDILRLRVEQNKLHLSEKTSQPLVCYDYTDIPPHQQQSAIEQTANELQASLDLTTGMLMKVAFFKLGHSQSDRLLFILHHLVIDGVSWRILLEDFQTANHQLKKGQSIQLPPKTTSFQQWSEHLHTYAESGLDAEYWRSAVSASVQPLPRDSSASREMQSMEIIISDSRSLLDLPKFYNVQVNEILLAALILTLNQWSGYSTFLVDLEGHGREELMEDVDISRTVGWFTSLYPAVFSLTDTNMNDVINQVKEVVRHIPHQGIGYGICRYLMNDSEIRSHLKNLPQSEISFNYLGQFLTEQFSEPGWQLAPESTGSTQAPISPYLFEITASIASEQLRLNWSYTHHSASTIAHLLNQFQAHLSSLIAHCQSPTAVHYTPADFALAELDQTQLEAVLSAVTFGGES